VVILTGSLVLLTSRTFVPQSNVAGKVTGILFFAMICAGLLYVPNLRMLLRYIVAVVSVLVFITLVVYTYTFFTQFSSLKEKGR